METKHTSYRISHEGKQILKLLSKKLGVTDTAILEIAIRKYGEMEGIRSCEAQFQKNIERVLSKHAYSWEPYNWELHTGQDIEGLSGQDIIAKYGDSIVLIQCKSYPKQSFDDLPSVQRHRQAVRSMEDRLDEYKNK